MHGGNPPATIPLPRSWPKNVKSGVLHVIGIAQVVLAHARGWAADCANPKVRMQGDLDRAEQEIAILREEIRIKDASMAQLQPHRRPNCWRRSPPTPFGSAICCTTRGPA